MPTIFLNEVYIESLEMRVRQLAGHWGMERFEYQPEQGDTSDK